MASNEKRNKRPSPSHGLEGSQTVRQEDQRLEIDIENIEFHWMNLKK